MIQVALLADNYLTSLTIISYHRLLSPTYGPSMYLYSISTGSLQYLPRTYHTTYAYHTTQTPLPPSDGHLRLGIGLPAGNNIDPSASSRLLTVRATQLRHSIAARFG